MAPLIVASFSVLAGTYFFLLFLLRSTQSTSEPSAILTEIPFFSPLIRMLKDKAQLHLRLRSAHCFRKPFWSNLTTCLYRDSHGLPIYTIRLPFTRIYVVNDTDLIPVLQRQWRTISFAAITASAGTVCGMSKKALNIMNHDLTNEDAFSISWPRFIASSLAPGPELDAINKKSVEVFSAELAKQQTGQSGTFTVGLREWSRHMMIVSTTEAIYGPQNPYRDPAIVDAWKYVSMVSWNPPLSPNKFYRIFESGFLTFSIFPSALKLFPKIFRARELAASAMIDYIRRDGYQAASGLVRKRFEHHSSWGLDLDDIGRGEIGNTFAILGNSTPCAFWVMYHIFSDEQVLADVRRELEALVREDNEGALSIDLASIRTSCPILLSTFQETLRYRSVLAGPRAVLEDVVLDDRFLLKKGSILLIPSAVQHRNRTAWGNDAGTFKYTRFMQRRGKQSRAAYRPFGGGQTLCPGRHFASTEIMMFSAICVLRFDIVPTEGKWVEPTTEQSPSGASFPIPDEDIMLEFRPRNPSKKWHISFSGSNEPIKIALEDC